MTIVSHILKQSGIPSKKGTNFNSRGPYKRTLFHWAAIVNHTCLVQYLVEIGKVVE